ncbi:hypothetical protein Franean1_3001 [Parafrankia sp. EAN1pec]|uniref:hypothetical protein n=1 Tax=Parafrankia sp. (strain EAN1pec) TaxID=298653 RepID=UPI000054234E|nr:hypothetical protein Franean1_3001 [Frankia sp. EAN1pec]
MTTAILSDHISGATPSMTETVQKTTGDHSAPPSLRSIILTARLSHLIPPAELARILGLFAPPVNPQSREWRALDAALDAYDHAAQSQIDLESAHALVNTAARALLCHARSTAVAAG